MKKQNLSQISLLLSIFLLIPSLANAHVLGVPTVGFLTGFSHPFGGFDHLFAMFAVGLWASQSSHRHALWLLPLTFVSVMILGASFGMMNSSFSGSIIEFAIVLSVLVFGILIALDARLSLNISVFLVALFALFHGYAHGSEMIASESGFIYGAGFAASTVLLHAFGVGFGLAFKNTSRKQAVQFAGMLIAVVGLSLFFV